MKRRSIILAVKCQNKCHLVTVCMSHIEVPSVSFGVKFPSCNKNIILPEFHCKIYFVFIFECNFHQSNLITTLSAFFTALKFSVDLNRKQENGNTRSPPSIREAKKFHSLHRFRYNSLPSELARVTVSRPYRRPRAPGAILIHENDHCPCKCQVIEIDSRTKILSSRTQNPGNIWNTSLQGQIKRF